MLECCYTSKSKARGYNEKDVVTMETSIPNFQIDSETTLDPVFQQSHKECGMTEIDEEQHTVGALASESQEDWSSRNISPSLQLSTGTETHRRACCTTGRNPTTITARNIYHLLRSSRVWIFRAKQIKKQNAAPFPSQIKASMSQKIYFSLSTGDELCYVYNIYAKKVFKKVCSENNSA